MLTSAVRLDARPRAVILAGDGRVAVHDESGLAREGALGRVRAAARADHITVVNEVVNRFTFNSFFWFVHAHKQVLSCVKTLRFLI